MLTVVAGDFILPFMMAADLNFSIAIAACCRHLQMLVFYRWSVAL
jgi:hypothetical protein